MSSSPTSSFKEGMLSVVPALGAYGIIELLRKQEFIDTVQDKLATLLRQTWLTSKGTKIVLSVIVAALIFWAVDALGFHLGL